MNDFTGLARAAVAVPAIDPAALDAHIRMIHQLAAASGVDGVLVLFGVGENPATGRREGPRVAHFHIGDADGMIEAAKGYSCTPHLNAYAPWAIFRKGMPSGSKGSERDVVAVLALVADQDNDKGQGGTLPLAAPYIVESSPGNFQAVYPLSRALPPAEAKPLSQALAECVGCDHRTKDVGGVWRIPGLLNWPNATKVGRGRSIDPQSVTVAREWGGELIDPGALPVLASRPKREDRTPRREDNTRREQEQSPHADRVVEELLARCGAGLRKLISSGAEPGEDRSAVAFSVICGLLTRGFAPPDIRRLIEAHPSGIGGRYAAGKDLDADIRRGQEKTQTNDAAETPDAWHSPDLSLLGTGRRLAPDFPLDLLGPYWAPWIERRAGGASAPVDYVATSLLACVGAMIANVRWPVAGASWSEPPLLWCGIVGSPSSSKSPAMDAAFDLVRHAEDRMAAGFDQDQRQHETTKQIAKAKRDAWEADIKIALRAGERPPNMPEDAVAPDDPVRPRVRVADFTIEKLGALTAALPRGLLVVRDELAGWLGAFDKYGGGGYDRAFAIEMYGGRSYIVDRVKNPEPLRIRHLSVGVLGGVQPDKLSTIIEGPDDGLASRLLWAWPDSLPEFSLSRIEADDTDARAAFARLADLGMGSDEHGNPEPKRLRLSTEAENLLEDFARDMSKRAHEASGMMSGALGKARGHALRLATVVEHLWWCGVRGASEPTAISAEAVTAAAGLVDGYFIPMAERVFGDASIPVAERAAMTLIRFLKRNGLATFNARDARREVGGPLRDAAAMDAACDALVEAGLIRGRFSRAGSVKGRAAKNYDVNPAIFVAGR